MAKVKLSTFDIEILNESDEGKKYLEYNDKVGGEPFGYCEGMPDFGIEDEFGGVTGLYDACIKRGITWQELLHTTGKYDEIH